MNRNAFKLKRRNASVSIGGGGDVNVPDFAPAIGWNGVATTPLTATAKRPYAPRTPDMTGRKPMAAVCELFKPFLTLTGDTIIGWQVQFGGRAHTFEVIGEGATVSVPRQTWQVRTDANNNAVLQYGYHIKYKTSTHLASWPNTKANLYVRITPADTTNFGVKVAGPFPINARTTEFDEVHTFTRSTGSGANHMGQDAIKSCLAYIQANPNKFIKFVCTETSQYRVLPASGTQVNPAGYNVFTTAGGVVCTLGDGSFGGELWSSFGHNGICIRGSGMKLDLSLMGFDGAGHVVALGVGAPGGPDRMWFDGCEIFHGNGEGNAATAASRGLSGSGVNLQYNGSEPFQFWMYGASSRDQDIAFMDVYAHDLAAYGLGFCRAAINCTVARVSGSCFENAGHVIGCNDTDVGGISTDTRTYKHAMDIVFTPTGGATAAYVEKTNGNAIPSDLVFYPNNKTATATLAGDTLTVTAVSGVTLAVGNYLGSATADPTVVGKIKITAQNSGTPGGAGVYTVSRRGTSTESSPRTYFVAQGVNIVPIDDLTTCDALASTISSTVPGMAATNDATQTRLASALTYRDSGGNIKPSQPIYTSLLIGNSISLATIYDVHADILVSNEDGCREGWIWSFHKSYNVNSTAWLSVGEATSIDCYVANCFATDTTYEWGVANPSYVDLAVQNPSYSGGQWYNVCIDNVTLTRKLGFLNWDGGTQVDSNSTIKRIYSYRFIWRSAGDADIVFKDVAIGYDDDNVLQLNMNSGNGCKLASFGGSPVSESTILDLITKVPVENGFLKMSDGSYAGAMTPASQVTTGETGNYGWNLVAP